ncbi:MAG: hypothetical protein KZQ64_06770 [gamma proteobacterium symbiont of Bathyaustriella thionipta]|nr:hypothetical protein [gamma proteobacterium symbiont of Bathyaustriella thionipta]MCU7950426.1 hypothetical protein [gamma proteobacterium symbiont of Bathyaustriella thionipta]MCU7953076.1 hypothetical protein [gamma proteobacterium symbiont of Bathyaustriella thionipta]MCU7956932.1 hypothetical protein [gamma proteobacterium symbiont of Bathyaustriella thionipta]MCU7965650.1 hypothetical protein [gamma proteobacterium symbiont of Bathyaustriella thionipta]
MIHYCYFKKQKGVSLVGAIFIMVALAAIGVAMVTLTSVTSTTSALNLEQTRAYYAAQSGMEWAIAKVVANDTNVPKTGSCENNVDTMFTIEGFNAVIICDSTCDIAAPASCCMGGSCIHNPRVTVLTVTVNKNVGDTYHVNREIQTTVSYDGN